MASFKDCSIKFPKGAQDNQLDLKNPILYLDEKSETFYAYGDGNIIYKSKDLLQWSSIELEDVSFRHPCIAKYKHEYRIYSTSQNAIELYVGFSPQGPFEYRETVIESKPDVEFYADCPSIATDIKTEEQYLICGKNGCGVFSIPLDVTTGLLAPEATPICLARRPKWMSSAVCEGYIIYHPTTKYYYLFVTYGEQGSDSNIRVARSKNINGPYADSNGKCLLDLDDFGCTIGQMCLSGYQFDHSQGFVAPSRPSVVKTAKNSWYVAHEICPIQDGTPCGSHMQIREIKWSSTGWPLFSPQSFAGEHTQQMQKEWLVGDYEFIRFKPSVPQDICHFVALHLFPPQDQDVNPTDKWRYAVPKDCMGRVQLNASIHGSWRLINETTLEITYWNYVETYRILPAWDSELNCHTIILTGKDSNGNACMAKKY